MNLEELPAVKQLQILEGRLIWLNAQASDFIRHNATLRKGYAAQADAVRIQIERLQRTMTK
jgi:hypothetical protein